MIRIEIGYVAGTLALGGYVRLNLDERKDAYAELKAQGLSNRKIADVLGVAEGTVRNDLRAAQNCADVDRITGAAAQSAAQNYAPPLDVLTGLAATNAVRDQIDADARKGLIVPARYDLRT